MSADRNSGRSTSRASRVICGMSVRRGLLWVLAKRSAISSLSLCTTGAMMCDGGSLSLICRMYSPRSVSMLCTPISPSTWFRRISSVTIDLLLMTFFTSCLRAISATSRAASAVVSANRTLAPRRVASASNVASQTSRFSSARLRRSFSASRVAVKSISWMAAARAVTNLVESLVRFCCRRWSASFWPARALNSMLRTCMRLRLRRVRGVRRRRPGPARYAARVCVYRRCGAGGPRC